MTNFNDLSKKPIRFLSFTGFKLEEFLALLPHFILKFQEFTVEGKIRQKRKYVEYKSAYLPTIENKLLFILTYLKGNDLQERIVEMFGLSQPKASLWIHLLHSVLNQTLNEIDVLPARDAESLEKNLKN
ncbi:transposase family protein [Candidatus Parabeggiatoa sp. HSG14]|uniref:transposase family protein n=1 Tax=Candidatus Parabeggiatoa sp. HSG14 TaxID=3055593 RepID=UPI0025A77351|nr:transposase family protein [Thiotrichales bacterium HSG14]